MKKFLNMHMMISVQLLIIALVVAVAAWVTHSVTAEARAEVEKNIDRQIVLMSELAEITDRNGADDTVAEIITDCPKRSQLETLLGKLQELPYKDLLTAQQLFESCGSYYSERKALMVSRLNREFEVLEDNVTLLEVLDSDTEGLYDLGSWERLIALEMDRSEALKEQVVIQREIIRALISGESLSSSSIGEQRTRAQQIAETLAVLNKQIDLLWSEINE